MARHDVVFLPGFMCDHRLFGPQVRALREAGHTCRVADYGQAASIDRMARDVLRQSTGKVALVGLSMGGIVALEAYRMACARVSHIALLNTTARADMSGASRKQHLRRVVAGDLETVLRDEVTPPYLARAHRTKEHLDLIEAMGRDLGAEAFISQTVALMTRPSQLENLNDVACPALIIAGDEDQVCPIDRQQEIAQAIPRAELRVLSPCGHLSTLEQPEAVSDALIRLLSKPACGPDLSLVPNPHPSHFNP